MKWYVIIILWGCTVTGNAQTLLGVGGSKTFMNGRTHATHDYGVSIDARYRFLDSVHALSFETGVSIGYFSYSHSDYYSNAYLANDPLYTPDYTQTYLHLTRTLELGIPVLAGYHLQRKRCALTPYAGLSVRSFLGAESSVSINGKTVAEGKGLRLTGIAGRIKLCDMLGFGVGFGSFEVRVEEEGMILQALSKNSFYYYYTDSHVHPGQMSLKLFYTL